MSGCIDCLHFLQLGDEAKFSKTVIQGWCVLMPQRVEIRDARAYFCGQYRDSIQTGFWKSWTGRSDNLWQEAQDQKQRAVTAEKKLKELRKQLRNNR